MRDQNPIRRLASLDVFRGLTIAGMILVNNPGDRTAVYPPLQHAQWHGWTPTDLIFPFFLFIVGVSMAFSFARRLDQGSQKELYLQVFRRTLILFLLGLFLNLFPGFDFGNLRVAGVLQRIALVYFFVSLIALNIKVKRIAWLTGGILALYWILMRFVPVPGMGTGNLTPEGNLAAFIDRFLMPGRLWQGTWDPEGILSTLPAIATGLLGYLTGIWLRQERDRREIVCWIFVMGWFSILLGVFWGIWFPINKNIWTSSYVLFTAGAGLQVLGVCYWLIDVKGYRRWAYPATVFGMNAIALYVLADLIAVLLTLVKISGLDLKEWIVSALASWFAPMNASLLFAIGLVLFCWVIMNFLYRRRIFIKI